jgi:hypothetical protein
MKTDKLKSIESICSTEEWDYLKHKIAIWDYGKLEAFYIILASGFSPTQAFCVMDEVISLSINSIYTLKESAFKLCKIINTLK